MTATEKPWQLTAAIALIWLETAALVAVAGFFLWPLVTSQAKLVPDLVALSGFILAAAGWLASLAAGLSRVKKSSRTPAMVWQLFQIVVGASTLSGPYANVPFGLVVLAPSIAVIVLLFSKPVAALLQREV